MQLVLGEIALRLRMALSHDTKSTTHWTNDTVKCGSWC